MPLGGLAGGSQSWINLFTGWNPGDKLPSSHEKGVLDNWTILCGANDRTMLMGPSLVSNIGSGYSTSFDLVGYLISKMPAAKGGTYPGVTWKSAAKLLLGYGDMKLAFGPSTSLLYGGPGGSSKRGPYWERIAGEWGNSQRAWGKGSKYSAEGSFKPGVVGKGKDDGLFFFEKDEIIGQKDSDQLGIKINRWEALEEFDKVLTDWKKDKYDDDMKKCYSKLEKDILIVGDKAAYWGMIVVFILDAAVAIMFVVYCIQQDQGANKGIESSKNFQKITQDKYRTENDKGDLKGQDDTAEENAKKEKEDAEKNVPAGVEEPTEASLKAKEDTYRTEQDEADRYEISEASTSDPEYESKLAKKRLKAREAKNQWDKARLLKEKFAARNAANNKYNRLKEKNAERKALLDSVQRDARWNNAIRTVRLVYKTAKILLLTVMETLENTEFLARTISEINAGQDVRNKDQLLLSGVQENDNKNSKHKEDYKDNLKKSIKQLLDAGVAVNKKLASNSTQTE